MDVFRTPDERFDRLAGFNFQPRYLEWTEPGGQSLRVHYIDEGPRDAPVMLMVHGEPTWSYLYVEFIPSLVAAGYRCIAADHIGFGRSDKVVDDDWYVIERHCEVLRHVIDTLDLQHITLICQDWGGPIGLRQAVDQPDRFDRLVILNTWLHHEGFEYSDGIRWWRAAATDPIQLGGDMPTGTLVAGTLRRPDHDTAAVIAAFDAPFPDERSKAGPRRFPWCIPFAEPVAGNAEDQQRCYEALLEWSKPVHVIFGDSDMIFTLDWGWEWAARIPGATFDAIANAGHFVQQDAPADVVATILRHAGPALT